MITIYAFTCEENGKAYIGCTAGKIAKRYREHKSLLKTGAHREPLLLADWNLYGPEKFFMEAVIAIEDGASVHVKRALESHVMERYKARGLLYNQNEASFMPTKEAIAKARRNQRRGFTLPPEVREKIGAAHRGIPKGHGAKISATKRAKKAMR